MKFPQDSYDAVERRYGAKIAAQFPNYGKFWEKYIGRNPATEPIAQLVLKYPTSMQSKDRRRFRKLREELHMAHYSLFCNLAGCYYHLEELGSIAKPQDTEEGFFRHWEHFECFYVRLGNCFYQSFHLWDVLAKLVRRKRDEYIAKESIRRKWKKFTKFHEKAKILRDNLVHYSRIAHKAMANNFYIPLIVRRGTGKANREELWTTQLRRKQWIPTDVRMRTDLRDAQKRLNDLHSLLIIKYGKALRKNRIRIRRTS